MTSSVMRTALVLEADAMKALQAYARNHYLPLGQAASELIRRGMRFQVGTRKVNGLPVFDAPDPAGAWIFIRGMSLRLLWELTPLRIPVCFLLHVK
jgi:hypothetical protein